MRFSQKLGITPHQKLVQRESIDQELKNSLWSAVVLAVFDNVEFTYGYADRTDSSNLSSLITCLWLHLFKKPVDRIPTYFSDTKEDLRKYFFTCRWHEALDFIEAIADYCPKNLKESFIKLCNAYLERENSAYRFIRSELTEITSKEEIDSVEEALSSPSESVNEHLRSALSLLNDRTNPDYRNSIKESISAVESLAKSLTGDAKATLGQALKTLEKSGKLHEALKSAFSALYGYTSDAEGIRHALLQESKIGKADAKFMLVSCSAFINYLVEISEVKSS
ncbi:hypothetical protein E8F11_17580 [Pseudomonas sp. BN417]|uniref:AbiJ-NTD4 domain-containing protein n=1 Tax=Pseudomonas sp. BN417 TaxID=2567890 RepID=UPI0024574DED|nr:hypothetical protein [Pseudomonas sp. BN417]MDH4556954.1 hypothetical protein [Pseudomonas sp. BN417]